MYFYIYIIFYIDKCKSIALYSFFFCIATNGVESLNISNQIFVTITDGIWLEYPEDTQRKIWKPLGFSEQ